MRRGAGEVKWNGDGRTSGFVDPGFEDIMVFFSTVETRKECMVAN